MDGRRSQGRHEGESESFSEIYLDIYPLLWIFLPAVQAWIPDNMAQCLAAFSRFCYAARQFSHDTDSLAWMAKHLRDFQDLRSMFLEENICDTFALPRYHSLVHYVDGIRLFGSLTGLCPSITESKHIHAVKKPWRRSNRLNPLRQMLKILSRLRKIAAMRSVLGRRRRLRGDVLSQALLHALRREGIDVPFADDDDEWEDVEDEDHVDPQGGARDEDERFLMERRTTLGCLGL